MSPTLLSGLLWIVFILYWSAAARGSAPALRSESAQSRQVHLLLMYGALALEFVRVPLLTGRWLPRTGVVLGAGLAIQLLGFTLAAWARRYLGRNWSAQITAKSDHQLVRSGPYRLVRHPIYSAMLAMFLGTTLISGTYHALLALGVISVAYVRKIRLEERTLEEVFGADYAAYRRETGAVIPWVL
ncbi:MAG TPA: isoprenylcysteine carboxylmethyltransferase family protein [Gemmatimonadales bacterium]|nr:isoprenylcysteine carboxylmethyltransferase family protein [Gemmatimonadales bacterium]